MTDVNTREHIERAAILFSRETGQMIVLSVPRPGRHHDCFNQEFPVVRVIRAVSAEETQGFVTSTGRFVDRMDGLKVATEAGQIKTKTGPADLLFSEDMW